MMKKTCLVLAALMTFTSATLTAAPIYNWKEKNGSTKYSDTPRGLKMGKSNVMNVRTHTVVPQSATRPTVPESLSDQQALLNQQIAIQNRQTEAENAKISAENQRIKEENCRNAQSSRRLAENARNRDQLVQEYDAKIAQYCN